MSELVDKGEGMGEAPVDLAHLSSMTTGDTDFAKELVEEFLVHSQGQVARIEQLSSVPDFNEVARFAHSLNGSSANLGANHLSHAARRLEHAAKEENGPEVLERLRHLNAAWADARRFLNVHVLES